MMLPPILTVIPTCIFFTINSIGLSILILSLFVGGVVYAQTYQPDYCLGTD